MFSFLVNLLINTAMFYDVIETLISTQVRKRVGNQLQASPLKSSVLVQDTALLLA